MSDQEIMFKVITLGDSGVGKTSIIRRFANNIFDENMLSTVGVGFAFKEMELQNKKTIKLKLIDTAGQEKFRSLAKSYFKNVDGVLFVYSFDIPESFESLKEWIESFNTNHNGKIGIPMLLIGNKSDLEKEEEVKKNEKLVEDFLKEYKELKYYKSSAKDNISINDLFQELAEKMYVNYGKGGEKSQNKKLVGKHVDNKKGHCSKCINLQ